MKLVELDMKKVLPDPKNPRIEVEEIAELAESIRQHGQIEPIKVEDLGNDTFLITEGHRRYEALRKNKAKTVNAIIEKKLSDMDRLMKRIAIDAQRKNLSEKDRDKAWEQLWNHKKPTVEEFCKMVGASKIWVEAFLDRRNIKQKYGEKYVNKLDVSTNALAETSRVKDDKKRKKVLDIISKTGMGRNDYRKLIDKVSKNASDKILDEIEKGTITVDDADNLTALSDKEQDIAIQATKTINTHKKRITSDIKNKKYDVVTTNKMKETSEKVNIFQKEFFETSSKIKRMRSRLENIDKEDLKKYLTPHTKKILIVCMDELESGIEPAIKQIKKILGDTK